MEGALKRQEKKTLNSIRKQKRKGERHLDQRCKQTSIKQKRAKKKKRKMNIAGLIGITGLASPPKRILRTTTKKKKKRERKKTHFV